jgi:hypothetical protein
MNDERDLTATCPECGAREAARSGTRDRRCAICFQRQVRGLDADFLDNYARAGARSHIIVAEACLKELVLSDVSDRKLLAATVYERFVAAASDLIALYRAIEQRRREPIMASMLGFRLDDASARRFFDRLIDGGAEEMLHAIDLPHPDQLPRENAMLDRREMRQVRSALAALLVDFERLSGFESVGRLALAGAARQLLGPSGLIDRTEWLTETSLSAGQLASVALDTELRRVEVSILSTDEETLGTVVDGIETLTRLVRNVAFSFVSLHSPEEFENGFSGGTRGDR